MKVGPVGLGIVGIAVLIVVFLLIAYPSPQPDASAVRQKYEDNLLSMPGITGVCVYPGSNEIGVMVENQSDADAIPGSLDGCPVKVTVTGRLTMYSSVDTGAGTGMYPLPVSPQGSVNQSMATILPGDLNAYAASITRNGTDRPVVGGISVGNADFPLAAGTLGLVVEGSTPGDLYILSCAHVLALSERGTFVPVGTPIWQPGGYNAGSSVDRIGNLSNYTQIALFRSGINYADAAIARLDVSGLPYVVLDSANGTFYTINGTTNVTPGDTVRKSGITTGITMGEVLATDVAARIFVTEQRWALFGDQILTDAIGAPGDSGSAVDKDGKFVGLYFAGSDNVGIVCKAEYIVGPLGITI